MDKNFIKNNGLTEAYNKFVTLSEYSFATDGKDLLLDEDEPEDEPEEEPENNPENTPGPQQGQPAEEEGGNPMGSQTGEIGQNQETMPDNAMGQPEAEMAPPQEEVPDGAEGDVAPNDTVIDVTDIADKAENVDNKINSLNDKLDGITASLEDKISGILSKTDSVLDSIKDLERRNPTPKEKLKMRTVDNYPFNKTIDQYWADKADKSNYDVYGDGKDNDNEEYEITKSDIEQPLSPNQFRQSIYGDLASINY